jgi:uncharacterized iron-regulated protein
VKPTTASGDHQQQLAIIQALFKLYRKPAICMEMFQRPKRGANPRSAFSRNITAAELRQSAVVEFDQDMLGI